MHKAPTPDGAPADNELACSRRNRLNDPSITDGLPVGIDVPGVGHVRTVGEESPAPRANWPGSSYCPGYVPPALYGEISKQTIIELLFAARALAESRLGADPWTPTRPTSHCKECKATAGVREPLEHRGHCSVGRVFGLIEEVYSEVLQPNPNENGKEAAPATEPVRARSGNSSRGLLGEPWDVRPGRDPHRAYIYDEEDDLVVTLHFPAGRIVARDRIAGRVIDAVNTCAGLEDEALGKQASL